MDNDKSVILAFIGITVLVLVGITLFCWYSSDIQAGVYRRQGIEMSTWEVFMGAKPAERTINIKSAP